ncbi:type II toxin-antitoxin system RelE/ParE family toxin [Candidatus Woesearchaeota archaeon]|nr:type II toxin-antitoxin system RelE/ParE family toxin [Candidatus Woesearchaeota archaeon]
MYKVIFDPEAIEFLEKLEKIIAKRIYDKISSTKPIPYHFWERLTGRKDFKLRIGDYRAIADINYNSKTIEVTRIGHRKNIYKKM